MCEKSWENSFQLRQCKRFIQKLLLRIHLYSYKDKKFLKNKQKNLNWLQKYEKIWGNSHIYEIVSFFYRRRRSRRGSQKFLFTFAVPKPPSPFPPHFSEPLLYKNGPFQLVLVPKSALLEVSGSVLYDW